MCKTKKKYTVRCHHRGRMSDYYGDIDYLSTKVFGYTLECGNSWNNKINIHPKTGKGLIKSLNQSVEETQGGCFERDYYELM